MQAMGGLLLQVFGIVCVLFLVVVFVFVIVRGFHRSPMQVTGVLLLVAGLIWGVIAFAMETTVTVPPPERDVQKYFSEEGKVTQVEYPKPTEVHSLDLAESRRTHLILAAVTFIAGVALLGFGTLSKSLASRTTEADEDGLVMCPFCAESIRPEAVICRFCGRELHSPAQRDNLEKTAGSTGVNVTCPGCGTNLRLDPAAYDSGEFSCPKCRKVSVFWGSGARS